METTYDAKVEKSSSRLHKSTNNVFSSISEKFEKISRIKLWSQRTHQDNHKIIAAFLHLEENGEVLFNDLKSVCTNSTTFPQYYVKKFVGHYPSMKTDSGNAHGKVFYDQNGIVNIWPIVREEIRTYFGK